MPPIPPINLVINASGREVRSPVQMSEVELSGTTAANAYTEGDPPMVIEPTLLLADDNTASATATITSGFTTGDVLSFTNDGSTMGTVAGSWNGWRLSTMRGGAGFWPAGASPQPSQVRGSWR